MKILVVEDENALREVIVRSLEKERYVVESATSFREASLKINDYEPYARKTASSLSPQKTLSRIKLQD